MAIRNIVKHDDAILREKSRTITMFDQNLSLLIDDMVDTMIHAEGAGLAAVQVGSLKRVFIAYDEDGQIHEFINPLVIESKGEQIFNEGCLSIPGQKGDVKRAKMMKIKAQDRQGNEFIIKAKDFFAVVVSHELDHLDGILYTDKLV
ncbi:MAG: peptide deformylase [Firmicutes bacterium]|nr:peptide deformylase [Bacillota bacterium]